MRVLWIAAVLWAGQLHGQAPTAPPAPRPPQAEAYRVLEPKYVEMQRLANLLQALGLTTRTDNELRTLVVAGSKEMIAAADEVFKRVDVPQQAKANIELVTYFLVASKAPGEVDSTPALAPVIKQLQSLFPYKSYRVAEALVTRVREGNDSRMTGHFRIPGGERKVQFIMSVRDLRTREGGSTGRVFSMRALEVNFSAVNERGGGDIATAVDMKEGQKVVVGKSNLTGDDEAVILVLSASVVN